MTRSTLSVGDCIQVLWELDDGKKELWDAVVQRLGNVRVDRSRNGVFCYAVKNGYDEECQSVQFLPGSLVRKWEEGGIDGPSVNQPSSWRHTICELRIDPGPHHNVSPDYVSESDLVEDSDCHSEYRVENGKEMRYFAPSRLTTRRGTALSIQQIRRSHAKLSSRMERLEARLNLQSTMLAIPFPHICWKCLRQDVYNSPVRNGPCVGQASEGGWADVPLPCFPGWSF